MYELIVNYKYEITSGYFSYEVFKYKHNFDAFDEHLIKNDNNFIKKLICKHDIIITSIENKKID